MIEQKLYDVLISLISLSFEASLGRLNLFEVLPSVFLLRTMGN